MENKAHLARILSSPGNEICSDCGSLSPTWASINNLVFVCTSCSGIHRSLGVEYSFVQSTLLDDWDSEYIQEFAKTSNKDENEKRLEFSVPSSVYKPNPNSSREEKEIYIRRKYISKDFIPGEGRIREAPVTAAIDSNAIRIPISVGEIEFVGIVKVVLLSGKSLINADVIGLSDPYVNLALGRQIFTSKVIANNLNPVFNETFMFSWDGKDSLKAFVYDQDFSNDDGNIYSLHIFTKY